MKERATFRLEPDVLHAARRAAELNRRPLTAEVDEALRIHLGLSGPSRFGQLEQRIGRLEAIAGSGRQRAHA